MSRIGEVIREEISMDVERQLAEFDFSEILMDTTGDIESLESRVDDLEQEQPATSDTIESQLRGTQKRVTELEKTMAGVLQLLKQTSPAFGLTKEQAEKLAKLLEMLA